MARALVASTGVGFAAGMADHAFMAVFGDAGWDTPPGSGYPTVLVTALLAVAVLTITLRHRSGPVGDLVPANA